MNPDIMAAVTARLEEQNKRSFIDLEELIRETKFSKGEIRLYMTQCQDEFRNLSGCVIKILTGGRILQISISWCQIEAEIRSFPTMYGKGGGICCKNWRNKGFRPKVMPKTRFF